MVVHNTQTSALHTLKAAKIKLRKSVDRFISNKPKTKEEKQSKSTKGDSTQILTYV